MVHGNEDLRTIHYYSQDELRKSYIRTEYKIFYHGNSIVKKFFNLHYIYLLNIFYMELALTAIGIAL